MNSTTLSHRRKPSIQPPDRSAVSGQMSDGQTYSIDNFADRAEVSVEQVHLWIARGLTHDEVDGKIYISTADFKEWLRTLKVSQNAGGG